MKKIITAVAILALFTFSAAQVWAWGCRGGGMGYGGGAWAHGCRNSNFNADPQAYQKFMDETVELRTELSAKQAEYAALMQHDAPDPNQAGQLARDMAGLRSQIQAKAASNGLRRGFGRQGNCPMIGSGY